MTHEEYTKELHKRQNKIKGLTKGIDHLNECYATSKGLPPVGQLVAFMDCDKLQQGKIIKYSITKSGTPRPHFENEAGYNMFTTNKAKILT